MNDFMTKVLAVTVYATRLPVGQFVNSLKKNPLRLGVFVLRMDVRLENESDSCFWRGCLNG